MHRLTSIQQLINDFSKVERSHYLPGTNEKESDILHSASVAMLAWQLYDNLHLDMNLARIMQYALAHDLVEVYAGDVNAYASAEKRIAKKKAEAKSLLKIKKETSDIFPNLGVVMKQYEERLDDESRFVWSVDKMQALIQGKIDNYRPFYEQGLSTADVRRVHGSHIELVHPSVKDLYIEIIEWFLNEYDDMAVQKDGVLIAHNPGTRK